MGIQDFFEYDNKAAGGNGLHRTGYGRAGRRHGAHQGLDLDEHVALPHGLSDPNEAFGLDDAAQGAFLDHAGRERQGIESHRRRSHRRRHHIFPR